MRRILVAGDRNWECFGLAHMVIKQMVAESAPEEIVIVHGNCRGVDRSFKSACKFMGVKDEPHEAEWNKYPKNQAGPIRNTEMVKLGAAVCLAFHSDLVNSKGTRDCATKALAAGIPTFEYVDHLTGFGRFVQLKRIEDDRVFYESNAQAVTA